MSNGDRISKESVDYVKETVSHQCEFCAFKAETEGGLCVHMGRKHKHIEQLDGGALPTMSVPSHNCNFCNFRAQTVREVIMHSRKVH